MKLVQVLSAAFLLSAIPGGEAPMAPADAAALNEAFALLSTYEWSDSREAPSSIEQAVVTSEHSPTRRRELEQRLTAVLATPTPRAAKDFACRQLSLIGTDKSVPALAPLLEDAELSHMARFALERIPHADAAAALRTALPKTSGGAQIGIINSLGNLADAKATGALTELMASPDHSVAAACIRALGKIGSTQAARALEQFLASAPQALQTLVSEACVVAGENLLRKGERAEAARVFRQFYLDTAKGPLRLATFRGLVAAEPTQADRILSTALAGEDEPLHKLAVQIIADLPGDNALQPFLNLLPSLQPAGQVALLDAVHARHDASARTAVLAMCDSSEPRVRLAALRALGVIGTAEEVPRLARLAASKSEEAEAARLALANLPGRGTSRTLLQAVTEAQPPVRVELIRALAARGATEAAPALAANLRNPDESTRFAALAALADLGDEKQAAEVITFLKSASKDDAFQGAQKTLEAIVTRAGPTCRQALISGVQGVEAGPRIVLLEQLGRVGGDEALRIVRTAVESGDVEVGKAAIRVLADWPDAGALPDLLQLAQQAEPAARREHAFRGYVRLCRETPMSVSERLNRLSEAARVAANTGEKTLVASALADVPKPGSLKLLAAYLDEPALVDAASVGVVKVASTLDAKHKHDVAPVLQRVVKECRNVEMQKQAKAILKKIGADTD